MRSGACVRSGASMSAPLTRKIVSILQCLRLITNYVIMHRCYYVSRIHEGGYSPGGQVLPDKSLSAVPVEVRGGMTNTWEVDAGCEGVCDVRVCDESGQC